MGRFKRLFLSQNCSFSIWWSCGVTDLRDGSDAVEWILIENSIMAGIIGLELWVISLIIFALAWVFQFIGHHIEGKKPSFLQDIQFLLIGPAWLMHFIFKKLNIPY